ncbi:MAG: NAD(P)/FAD-dependent oxidoreductase, partial [Pelistega sp.]|nr:NAD(P)/FAD-dependent oxidoreductase [Pelistega sp.]
LEIPAKDWVKPRFVEGEQLHDVVIIGAGMAGLTVAAALKFLGIKSILLDRAPTGFEGPWATTARMETLRSPKQLTGPALGIPSLTFRAWYVAQFGQEAWDSLDKIPRLQWMDYLRWYRKVTAPEVHNDTHVIDVELHKDNYLVLTVQQQQTQQKILARRLILATGRDGLGGAALPAFVEGIPRQYWAHSSDVFDYSSLKGKKVAVIGAGASAMDSAATALEEGAASVEMLIRRQDIPRVNKGKGAGSPGLVHGYADLPDEWKWHFRHYINKAQVPPPKGSTLRVSQHPNAFFNVDCAIEKLETTPDNQLAIHTTKGVFTVDFLFLATGFKIDWSLRPEYSRFAPLVRTWGNRFIPPSGEEDNELAACPDLGKSFEFQAKEGIVAPTLSNIYCFSYPAVASHGTVSGDIPAISDGARAIAQGIASSLFNEDVELYYEQLKAYADPELDGDEWQAALPPNQRNT